jgi:hypothetical protein
MMKASTEKLEQQSRAEYQHWRMTASGQEPTLSAHAKEQQAHDTTRHANGIPRGLRVTSNHLEN